MKYAIYLVEDEIKLNNLLKRYLEKEGYLVTSFLDGSSALNKINDTPHIWILDIMLPDIDGYELIKKIKEVHPEIPVVFMSARDSDIDRLLGLKLGSDDYISKPFLPQELVIRCTNIIKRIYGTNDYLIYGDYKININKRIVFQDHTEIKLTTKEFDLLVLFMQNINKSLTREEILHKVWENDYFGSDRVVDDLVRRLKKKCQNLKIEAIYGYGYRLL